ncbi:MAG: bacteriohemerythrin [Thermodesulfobacteriota bacterium]
MELQWTKALSIGIDEIDNQHKELFIRINNLLDTMGQKKEIEEVGRVFGFLEDYVKTHFNTEEGYMSRYNYPEYQSHRAQHREFIKDFSLFKEKFEREPPSGFLVIQFGNMLVEWWINHIRKVDKSLGAFLNTKL